MLKSEINEKSSQFVYLLMFPLYSVLPDNASDF